ncbi:MAG: hypothetical protein A3K19_06010 [Lentisphaerae bacterium RIFOXYB12_FULL_65_16]|nr:MAG: hypothetical protein A3K18_34610 [Lentisphaerae bacterium RIFOXYA12_64_32]OGV94027.1 MAG: hypothetical protein A3K19_06010 [Lentisphaerae bacterium RIFOXYB12_FULL_65_16]
MRADAAISLAALHDVGKVCPGFQAKCAEWLSRQGLEDTAVHWHGVEPDHAKVSQKTLQGIIGDHSPLRYWAAIVGAHHGRLKGDRLLPLRDGGDAWGAQRRRLVEEMLRDFGPLPDEPPPTPDCGPLWFVAGLVAVADWLASDERTFPPSKDLASDEIATRVTAQLARLGFAAPPTVPPDLAFADLFPDTPTPNSLQQAMARAAIRPGVYVVEGPMGCGKTEAALTAAYRLLSTGQATGLYFALPTRTTSNRIHRRVSAFLDRLGGHGRAVRLVHGTSWLLDDAPAVDGIEHGEASQGEARYAGRDWFASPRRALLAPFGVGTVDQALLGVVAAKHFFVRQFGLAGKVVVLDEIHSYDLYTGTLIDQLVRRLRELQATVIVLSATLTARRRRELLGLADSATVEPPCSEYPLLSAVRDGDGTAGPFQIAPAAPPPKRINVSMRPESELADACLARAERGACVLWIRNTVDDAQATYRTLCALNRCDGPELGLLHARFPQFRRDQLEDDWMERLGRDGARRPARGCVLVSTQVAEQSVDIDADLLITDVAPTDMLLQRLGRLWRHERTRPAECAAPEIWISAPALAACELRTAGITEIKAAFGKSAKVYAPYVLVRTFDLWRERTVVTLPGDIRPLLEATYAELPDEPVAWCELREAMEERKKKLASAAINATAMWANPALDDEEGVQTRWGDRPSGMVLPLPRLLAWDGKNGARFELLSGETCDVRTGKFSFAAAKAIHRNLVRVPLWTVKPFLDAAPAWLREYVTELAVPVKVQDGKLLTIPGGEDTGLEYRPNVGVVIRPKPRFDRPAGRLREEEDDDESYD